MKRNIVFAILSILIVIGGPAYGAVFSQTYDTNPSGVIVTTTVDTDQRSVRYDFDFTLNVDLVSHGYNQIGIDQPGVPTSAIDLTWPRWPISLKRTSYKLVPEFQMNYESVPPPMENYITFHYVAGYNFAGFDSPNNNFQITLREPPGGFPPGQEDNVTAGAYTPIGTSNGQNQAPVANAGADQAVFVSDTVFLDGSGSSDVDGNPLTFSWSFVSKPAGSTAALSDSTAEMPTFVADLPGTYVVKLIVNDGSVDSVADTVNISTANAALPAINLLLLN